MDKSEYWLSPMNRVIWYKAFSTRATKVKLRDGREFTIRYEVRRYYSNGLKGVAFVSPVRGHAPCGWFRLDKVADKEWITESPDDSHESLYLTYLDEFVADDSLRGVAIVEHWPALKDRLSTTIRRGFATAKAARGRRADSVQIVGVEGKVFLIKEDPCDE